MGTSWKNLTPLKILFLFGHSLPALVILSSFVLHYFLSLNRRHQRNTPLVKEPSSNSSQNKIELSKNGFQICRCLLSHKRHCSCDKEYIGLTCELYFKCKINPCQNSGTCTKGLTDYKCICSAGYMGTNCQINVDECSSNPCTNNGTCIDKINGFICQCFPIFSGTCCEDKFNLCSVTPCAAMSTCIIENMIAKCICLATQTGRFCNVTNSCFRERKLSKGYQSLKLFSGHRSKLMKQIRVTQGCIVIIFDDIENRNCYRNSYRQKPFRFILKVEIFNTTQACLELMDFDINQRAAVYISKKWVYIQNFTSKSDHMLQIYNSIEMQTIVGHANVMYLVSKKKALFLVNDNTVVEITQSISSQSCLIPISGLIDKIDEPLSTKVRLNGVFIRQIN